MPIDLPQPAVITPAVQADRQLVTGFAVHESDENDGLPIANPQVVVWWVKLDKATGQPRSRGVHRFSAVAFATEKPDGAKSFRANIKARLYAQLVDDGVFAAGAVT